MAAIISLPDSMDRPTRSTISRRMLTSIAAATGRWSPSGTAKTSEQGRHRENRAGLPRRIAATIAYQRLVHCRWAGKKPEIS